MPVVFKTHRGKKCLSALTAKKLPKGTSGLQRSGTSSREPYVSDRQPQQQSVSPPLHTRTSHQHITSAHITHHITRAHYTSTLHLHITPAHITHHNSTSHQHTTPAHHTCTHHTSHHTCTLHQHITPAHITHHTSTSHLHTSPTTRTSTSHLHTWHITPAHSTSTRHVMSRAKLKAVTLLWTFVWDCVEWRIPTFRVDIHVQCTCMASVQYITCLKHCWHKYTCTCTCIYMYMYFYVSHMYSVYYGLCHGIESWYNKWCHLFIAGGRRLL